MTGAALIDTESVWRSIEKLRRLSDLPIVIGFGIKDAASAKAMGSIADGVIIGSALVEKIAELSGETPHTVERLRAVSEVIRLARGALDER